MAAKLTSRGARYQPLAFGWRDAVAVATGAVASYLSVSDAAPLFPALSVQVPLTTAAPLSGPP